MVRLEPASGLFVDTVQAADIHAAMERLQVSLDTLENNVIAGQKSDEECSSLKPIAPVSDERSPGGMNYEACAHEVATHCSGRRMRIIEISSPDGTKTSVRIPPTTRLKAVHGALTSTGTVLAMAAEIVNGVQPLLFLRTATGRGILVTPETHPEVGNLIRYRLDGGRGYQWCAYVKSAENAGKKS